MLWTPPLWRSLSLVTSLLPPLSPHLGNSIPSWSHIVPSPVPQLLLTRV